MNINLGSIQIPINATTKTFAILAKRGAGKTYTGAVMAEEFYKVGVPFVVFDPIDVWWGLRLDKNGKDKGLPVVVFGVEHADIPLNRDMGREIAQSIVKENVSCVISTFGMPKKGQRYLIAEFAEELLKINNTPRHIFIEEAHEFVPQRIFGGLGIAFNAVSNLVVMGRNRRLGVTMLNQRAATINKDVLTQLDTLIAMRSVGPQDRKALQDWVEYHSAEGDFEKFLQSLPSLPTGEGWIWSPEFLGTFQKIKIRKRETYHPDIEKSDIEIPIVEQADIQSFIEKFNKKNKKEIVIKRQKKEIIEETSFQEEVDIRQVKNEYESQLLQKDLEIRKLNEVISAVQKLVGVVNNATPAVSVSKDAIALWQTKLSESRLSGKIFRFLVENAGRDFTKEQICLAIGVPSKAGHTSNEFGKVMRTGAVVREGNKYRLNPNP